MLDIKRGDTLSYTGFLPEGWLPAGSWSVRCKAYDKKDKVSFVIDAELVEPAGDELRYMLKLYASAASTGTWPPRKLDADVEFTDSSALPDPFVFSSDTFQINVIQDVA